MGGIETIAGDSALRNYVASVDWHAVFLLCLVLIAIFAVRRVNDVYFSWVKDRSPISPGATFIVIVMVVISVAIISFVAFSITGRYR